MTENYDREEQGFREALAKDAESAQFEPLAPGQVPQRRSIGAGWTAGIAAIVVIGLVAALGAGVLGYLMPSGAAMPASAGVEVSAEDAGQAAPQAPEAGVGEPEPGWRWESFRDVVIQVPADWGYDRAPTSAWCISQEWPTAPFVDTAHGLGMVATILCEGVIPADKLVPHLSMQPEEFASVLSLPDGWTTHTRTIGQVVISVVTDDAGSALAEEILATAKEVPVDHNGCPTDAPPATVETDLAGFAGFPIVVCAYHTDAVAWPGLLASARLDGDAASKAWDAIYAAPGGGGPDGSKAECGGMPADPVAVLLVEGTAVGFQFSGCTGNGLSDAGADGGLREVTEDLCRTLLVPPFTMDSAVGPAASRCLAAVTER